MLSPLRCICIATSILCVTAHAQSDTATDKLASAKALDRGTFVQLVLRVNPSIEAARQGWRAALARERQAGAFDDPMVETAVAPLSIGSSQARFGFEIGVSQALPWFGKRALERDVMKAEAAASASDLESTRRELAMTAVSLYLQYYVVLQSLEINAHHGQLMQSAREAATAQLEAGRGSVEELLQAETELAQLERETLELTAERDIVVAQMNELLHREPTAVVPPAAALLAVADDMSQTRDAKLLATEAVRSRPEIQSARFHERAESLKEDAANRAYYPSITVSTSYSSMWDMAQHRWMVGMGVNLPLATDRRAGAVDEARAMRARYASEVARMSATAAAEVYVALRKLESSEQQLLLFQRRLLPVAQQRVEAAQASFTTSRTPLVSVIDAQKSLRSIELDQRLVQAEHERRHAELDRVLGRIPGLERTRTNP